MQVLAKPSPLTAEVVLRMLVNVGDAEPHLAFILMGWFRAYSVDGSPASQLTILPSRATTLIRHYTSWTDRLGR
jgi:hypothetical protein